MPVLIEPDGTAGFFSDPEHDVLQEPAQLLSQLPTQPLLQSSEPQDVKTDVHKVVNARIGNAPFAALLKNSLRDWSPSFFSFFFITLIVFNASCSRIRRE